jgi:hypothetical protein
VALNGEKRNASKFLGWEDNIKMEVKNRTGGHRPD